MSTWDIILVKLEIVVPVTKKNVNFNLKKKKINQKLKIAVIKIETLV